MEARSSAKLTNEVIMDATRKDVEDCKQTVEGLADLARKMGYRGSFNQLYFNNGASATDLFNFFGDNPGAIEAVLTWVADQYGDELDTNTEMDEEEDEEGEEFDEEGA